MGALVLHRRSWGRWRIAPTSWPGICTPVSLTARDSRHLKARQSAVVATPGGITDLEFFFILEILKANSSSSFVRLSG